MGLKGGVSSPDGAQIPPEAARIDPRVARQGGSRRDPRSNYDFPGMTEASSWCRSDVHKATRYYGCALCGQRFSGPHAVYTHLAKRHER